MFRWFVFHIIFSFSYCIFEVMSLHWLQSRASLKSISPLWSCLLCSFSVSAVPPPPQGLACLRHLSQSEPLLLEAPALIGRHMEGASHLGTWLCPGLLLLLDGQLTLCCQRPFPLPFYPSLLHIMVENLVLRELRTGSPVFMPSESSQLCVSVNGCSHLAG